MASSSSANSFRSASCFFKMSGSQYLLSLLHWIRFKRSSFLHTIGQATSCSLGDLLVVEGCGMGVVSDLWMSKKVSLGSG